MIRYLTPGIQHLHCNLLNECYTTFFFLILCGIKSKQLSLVPLLFGICAFLHLATIGHFLSQCLIPLQSAVSQRHQTTSPSGSLGEGWSMKFNLKVVFGLLEVQWRRTGLISLAILTPLKHTLLSCSEPKYAI